MRLISFRNGNGTAVGVKTPRGVVELGALADLPNDMTELLLEGDSALARVASLIADYDGHAISVSDNDLLPVVPRPGKIVCLGLNYVEHAKEGGMAIPKTPVVFLRVTTSLASATSTFRASELSEQLDYEAELGFVIGKRAFQVDEADALDHVAGYTVFNDLTYRDYQFNHGPQWTLGKNFDSSGPLGPDLVTPDELPAGADGLFVRTTINGEVVQNGNTSDMIFKVPAIVAALSKTMALEPGDVVVTGTPAGVGAARKPPRWLKAGDVCEVEIEKIGRITTRIDGSARAAAAS